jgi:Fe-S-cluster containining protein
MKDGPVRNVLTRLALGRYRGDLAFTRLVLRAKGEPRYTLAGRCNGCGRCCETPMIQVGRFTLYLRVLRWLTLTWHRVVNGFVLVREYKRERIFAFRCTHYDPATKLCDSYDSRPGMCRDYPRNLVYAANPEFMKECGFYAVRKGGDGLRASLQNLPLTPEQRAELERKLHLLP